MLTTLRNILNPFSSAYFAKELVRDEYLIEARAQLNLELVGSLALEEKELLGLCMGAGTAKDQYMALRKAMNEAIERWTFLICAKSYKYNSILWPNVPVTTKGFAAHHSINPYKARKLA